MKRIIIFAGLLFTLCSCSNESFIIDGEGSVDQTKIGYDTYDMGVVATFDKKFVFEERNYSYAGNKRIQNCVINEYVCGILSSEEYIRYFTDKHPGVPYIINSKFNIYENEEIDNHPRYPELWWDVYSYNGIDKKISLGITYSSESSLIIFNCQS